MIRILLLTVDVVEPAQRQMAKPKKAAKGTIPDEGAGTEDVKPLDALVAIIPSETFAFYTPLATAITSQLLKNVDAPDRYMGLRWSLWVAGIAVAFGLVAKDKLTRKARRP